MRSITSNASSPILWSLHGDRAFADDPAVVGGIAFLDNQPVLVLGQQKGRDTRQKLHRNFGMPKPEGYRKALRLMELANKYHRPIITLLDTPGAYPGIDAEERGQAEAIALNLREMSRLRVPVIAVVIGEGGSGGALGLGVANRVLMMENSVYSVISPESCAAIIWRDSAKAELAAAALKLTADDLQSLKLIDGIIPEPEGGAQNDPDAAVEAVKQRFKPRCGSCIPSPPINSLRRGTGSFEIWGTSLRRPSAREPESPRRSSRSARVRGAARLYESWREEVSRGSVRRISGPYQLPDSSWTKPATSAPNGNRERVCHHRERHDGLDVVRSETADKHSLAGLIPVSRRQYVQL
jgi:acetyl-CoA carboxylase carboxyl transferase subunit alpha